MLQEISMIRTWCQEMKQEAEILFSQYRKPSYHNYLHSARSTQLSKKKSNSCQVTNVSLYSTDEENRQEL